MPNTRRQRKQLQKKRLDVPTLTVDSPLVKGGKTVGELFHTLISAQEELRILFNQIASPTDTKFIDLVVARLVKNDEFHKAMARSMFEAVGQVTAEQLSGTVPAAKAPVVDCPPVGAGGAFSPNPVPRVTRDVSVGYYPFEGSNGYVDMTLDETGENVNGGEITEGAVTRTLDPENERDAAIIYAVNQSYTFLRTKAEPPVAVAAGDRFYFREVDHTKPEVAADVG